MNAQQEPEETLDQYLAAAEAAFDNMCQQVRGTPQEAHLSQAELLTRAEVVITCQDRFDVAHQRAIALAEEVIRVPARALN